MPDVAVAGLELRRLILVQGFGPLRVQRAEDIELLQDQVVRADADRGVATFGIRTGTAVGIGCVIRVRGVDGLVDRDGVVVEPQRFEPERLKALHGRFSPHELGADHDQAHAIFGDVHHAGRVDLLHDAVALELIEPTQEDASHEIDAAVRAGRGHVCPDVRLLFLHLPVEQLLLGGVGGVLPEHDEAHDEDGREDREQACEGRAGVRGVDRVAVLGHARVAVRPHGFGDGRPVIEVGGLRGVLGCVGRLVLVVFGFGHLYLVTLGDLDPGSSADGPDFLIRVYWEGVIGVARACEVADYAG